MKISKETLQATAAVAGKAGRFASVLALDGEVVALDGYALLAYCGERTETAVYAVIPAATAKAAAAGMVRHQLAEVSADELQVFGGARMGLDENAEFSARVDSLAGLCPPPEKETFVGGFGLDLLSNLLSACKKLGVSRVELSRPNVFSRSPFVIRGLAEGGKLVYALLMPMGGEEPELAGRRPKYAVEKVRPPAAAPASEPEAEPEAAPAE